MYPFVTHTFNPIKGCEHNCIYCYVNSLAARYGYSTTPRFSKKELKTNLGQNNFIFVGSTSDMFGKWVPHEWIRQVMEYCTTFNTNTYLFQTKNPWRFMELYVYDIPKNSIFGTTIETNRDTKVSDAPPVKERYKAMKQLKELSLRTMVSIEPVIDFDEMELLQWIYEIKPEFVSIGADSKGHNLPEPDPDKVANLINNLKEVGIKVYVKKNILRICPLIYLI